MSSWVKLRRATDANAQDFNCAYLDLDKLREIDPDIDDTLVESETNISFAVSYAVATYGATVNLKHYFLGYWNNTYNNVGLGISMYDVDKPSDPNAKFLVDFINSQGYKAQVGDKFSTIFQQQRYRTPPPDIATANDYFKKRVWDGKEVYDITHTFTPDEQGYWNVSTNSSISSKFFTTTGNSIGCCVGIGTSYWREFACVGTDYLNGHYSPVAVPENNIGLSPAVQDNRDTFGDGGWMYYVEPGSGVPGYTSNSMAFSHDNPYNYSGSVTSDPYILRQTTVQMVATIIDGKKYIGMAALEWTGELVTGIQVCFLPTWFWGDFYIDPEVAPPMPEDHYFGPPQDDANGGDGTYRVHIDVNGLTTVPVSPLESVANTDPGIHIYRITSSHLKQLTNYLWTSQDTYKDNALNIQQGLLSLHMLPTKILDKAVGENPSTVNFVAMARGYLPASPAVDFLNATAGHWVSFKVGKVDIPLYYGTFHDYEGYTSIMLNLPFINTVSISPSLCNGGSIEVWYHCDIITGDVVAEVLLTAKPNTFNTDSADPDARVQTIETKTVQYYSGNCAVKFPIYGSSTNPADTMNGISGAIQGGMQIASGIATGSFGGAIGGAFKTISGVQQAMYPPVSYNESSTYAGTSNVFNNKQCSITITRPKAAFSDAWVATKGVASSKYVESIGKLHIEGQKTFTVIDYAKTWNIPNATAAEKLEIERLLREGVYV